MRRSCEGKKTKKKMQHQPISLSLSSSLRISVGVHAGLLYPSSLLPCIVWLPCSMYNFLILFFLRSHIKSRLCYALEICQRGRGTWNITISTLLIPDDIDIASVCTVKTLLMVAAGLSLLSDCKVHLVTAYCAVKWVYLQLVLLPT